MRALIVLAAVFASSFAFALRDDQLDKAEVDSLKANGNALICRFSPDSMNALLLQGNAATGKKVQIRNIISTDHGPCILFATVDR